MIYANLTITRVGIDQIVKLKPHSHTNITLTLKLNVFLFFFEEEEKLQSFLNTTMCAW